MAGRLLLIILIYSFHKIHAQALLPPKLEVKSPVITETDSVTLNCKTSSSVSQCYFFTVTLSEERIGGFSCLQTLTGTELLLKSHQSPPAEVKVKCFYTVMFKNFIYPSPHSDMYSIIISKSDSTTQTTTLKQASDNVEKESHVTQAKPESTMTTGSLTPADTTPMNPASGDERTAEKMTMMIAAGVTAGVLFLGLVLLFFQSRTEKSVSKRPKINVAGLQAGYDETYSVVTYECNN
ncbi:uncharacterized protein LOC131965808 [Centropristis striata]|uniref:uncharacterized protein LOC131965808 n=1 Tax=Centropristis striata TaxID=184440 RepID=UPI0027E0ED78|nr:uncharacterized protein LOC131965808 [Centropristis striata]